MKKYETNLKKVLTSILAERLIAAFTFNLFTIPIDLSNE